ncbi:MAG: hypothetical protein LBP23_01070 [Treponema sp.]|jgi:hypothetical protein|nr:hypothetical protein [Treponema sp.]
MENTASVLRIRETGEREATLLEHGTLRVIIDDRGGMVPELSCVRGRGRINAHWIPHFRGNSGKPYDDTEHGAFWKGSLLYELAGNFCCVPNFGPGQVIDGVTIPPHGWTANHTWRFDGSGVEGESGAAWALSSMESPDRRMPLAFKKLDMLLPDHPVHYTGLEIKNRGDSDIEICAGWHNTLAPPLLQQGCRISAAAKRWTVSPAGGEFDTTSRLALGAEFGSLAEAPLAGGGTEDLSLVPAPLGYTDFVCGAIGDDETTGWSALVNPFLKLAYVCFFAGPAAAAEDDIILRFNDLWMQYGGRPFTPWALYEGGSDLSYCLGTENGAAAFAYGLEYSRQVKRLMGAPSTFTIPAGQSRTLRYGSLFAPYEGNLLDGGIRSVKADDGRILCGGTDGCCRFPADGAFGVLKRIQGKNPA